MDISSSIFVEVLGTALVWGKETVGREGLGKQTTAQQNKNTKEKAFLTLCLGRSGGRTKMRCRRRRREREQLEKVKKFIVELGWVSGVREGTPEILFHLLDRDGNSSNLKVTEVIATVVCNVSLVVVFLFL